MLTFDIVLKKETQRQVNDQKIKEQLQAISNSANRNALNKWDVKRSKVKKEEINGGWHYSAIIRLVRSRYNDEIAVRKRFQKTVEVMEIVAKKHGWVVGGESNREIEENGEVAAIARVIEELQPKKKKSETSPYLEGKELPPLTDDVLETYFSRIYDRESHIRIIYDHLCLAVRTKFKTRHHTLLKGKPSCAKTELFLAFIEWLGDDLIESIDASTMTKAGLERMLMQKATDGTLKPILIMEEIEKTADENVSCLIQVMDARGKIQRVNAHTVRDGEDGAMSCPIIVWGTCNDEDALEKFHKGALYSRFSNKLDCYRPDQELMGRILCREVEEISPGISPEEIEYRKEVWVPIVLEFCYNELRALPKFANQYDDPRFARSLLAGGNRLLDTGPRGFLNDFRKTNGIKKV